MIQQVRDDTVKTQKGDTLHSEPYGFSVGFVHNISLGNSLDLKNVKFSVYLNVLSLEIDRLGSDI